MAAGITYTVQQNQSMLDVALQVGGCLDCLMAICQANNLAPESLVNAGQVLTIPAGITVNKGIQLKVMQQGIVFGTADVWTCGIVSGLSVGSITGNSAVVTWMGPTEHAVNYMWQVTTDDVAPVGHMGVLTGGATSVNTLGYTPSELTTYYVWVCTLCTDGSYSAWQSISFSTAARIYTRMLSIDHTRVIGGSQSNFPVLLSISDATLKTIANGGHVAHDNGDDILFGTDSGCTSLLNWEIEDYDGAAGTLDVWALMPEVSNSIDQAFYMQYGNSAIVTFQGGAKGTVWSAYNKVYHLTVANIGEDSTALGENLSNLYHMESGAGKIGGGAAFDGTAFMELANPTVPMGHAARTMSCWFKMTGSGAMALFGYGNNSYPNNRFEFYYDGASYMDVECQGSHAGFAWANDGNWHHLVASYTGGLLSTGLTIYLDGVAQTIVSLTDGVPASDNNEIMLGQIPGFAGAYYTGLLDECRVMPVAVSAGWVGTEYNNQNNPGNVGAPGFISYGAEF